MLMVGEKERRDRFGYALQQALTARGMSERQLAQRLEIDPRQVARWRTGKGLPDLYQTQALVAVLRVSEELFRNPPPVPEPPAYPIEDYLLDAVERGAAAALWDEPPRVPDAAEPVVQRPPRRR
jgi:transcriptional regulator with XRE-family HTH domain